MSQFHRLTIKQVRAETREAVSILFEVPTELKHTFRYTQGQHVVIRTHLEGLEVRRSYSICSAVQDDELRVAIKRVSGGRFSAYAHETLKAGHQLEVMPPAGQFNVPLEPSRRGRYLMVAAGSGITPILSILKTTLHAEPLSQVTLLYGNRSSTGALFREQLEDLKNTYLGRLNLIFVFSREQQDVDLYNGRIDAAKCEQLFGRWLNVGALDAAFICGPQLMTDTVRQCLQAAGMAPGRIHAELFGVASESSQQRARGPAHALTAEISHIRVISDGRELTFDLPRNTLSVLDAGNAIGAELPYSCKAGVCSTCKCRVVEGEVEMDSNHALEDYEVAAGYVLSCQSFPVSQHVVLDFDQV